MRKCENDTVLGREKLEAMILYDTVAKKASRNQGKNIIFIT